jgi:hypothetical protein
MVHQLYALRGGGASASTYRRTDPLDGEPSWALRGAGDTAEWEGALTEALANLTPLIGADDELGRALRGASTGGVRCV